MQKLRDEYSAFVTQRAATPLKMSGESILITHVDFVDRGITNIVLQNDLVPPNVWTGLLSGVYSAMNFNLSGDDAEAEALEWERYAGDHKRPPGEATSVYTWLSVCFSHTNIMEYDDTGYHMLRATKPVFHMFLYA